MQYDKDIYGKDWIIQLQKHKRVSFSSYSIGNEVAINGSWT